MAHGANRVERAGRVERAWLGSHHFGLLLGVLLFRRVLVPDPTLDRICRGHVHPVLALVTHDVGGYACDEERHQGQRRDEHPLYQALLPSQVHEVLNHEVRLHHGDPEGRDQSDPHDTDEGARHADHQEDHEREVDLPVVGVLVALLVVVRLHLLVVVLVHLLVLGHVGLLRDVEQGEQENPNQVDEVPIDADELHAMEFSTPPRVRRYERHDDRPRDHVEPV